MQFESVSAALTMNGHGVFVWAVFAVSAVVIVGMLLLPALSSRRLLESQRSQQGDAGEAAAPTVRIEEVNNASGS